MLQDFVFWLDATLLSILSTTELSHTYLWLTLLCTPLRFHYEYQTWDDVRRMFALTSEDSFQWLPTSEVIVYVILALLRVC